MDVRYKEDEYNKALSERIENELSDKYSQLFYKEVQTEVENIRYDEGGLNSGNLWRFKNKINKKVSK